MSPTVYPKYVVTVLRDRKPVVMVEYQQTSERDGSSEVSYPQDSDVSDCTAVLEKAAHALGYVLWKDGGPLPTPPDLEPKAGDDDILLPF